ncbi:hypothetical protein [Caulobacter sp. S45]|uniref:hypothetical protein n=1 Tax=Caulobacter sp. S45 TaxID=1641861 RepID=UPI00131B3B84|nr:hypothetical protein [Caulobacter sp. S45]
MVVHKSQGDYINLTVGGLTTAGLEISIDLETGDAVKRSSKFGSVRSGEQPDWVETKRQLGSDELNTLRNVIEISLAEGLRSKACDDEDEQARKQGQRFAMRPPIADSIISLSVRLGGHMGHAPERQCMSPAFDRLWTATYNAASGSAD